MFEAVVALVPTKARWRACIWPTLTNTLFGSTVGAQKAEKNSFVKPAVTTGFVLPVLSGLVGSIKETPPAIVGPLIEHRR